MITKKDKKITKRKVPTVAVIVTMRNAASTVLHALESLEKQEYPIAEIIVVDNVSKDNSCELVIGFSKKSKIPVTLLQQKVDNGVSASYNRGARFANSELFVFMTSDSMLSTSRELGKLVEPLVIEPKIVGSYPINILPRYVWDTYNFWQKFYSIRDVDEKQQLFLTKFDCVRANAFHKIEGYDEINFGGDNRVGCQDADFSVRLRRIGKVMPTTAEAIHLHYKGGDFSLVNMLVSRKEYARGYGRFIRKHIFDAPLLSLEFLMRPTIAFLPFIPYFHIPGLLLLIAYAVIYTRKMFITFSTLTDPRIIFTPFINIFFLYYEFYWLMQGALFVKHVRIAI